MPFERLKKELKESENRYRRLFEAARDGIFILKADTGKIIDVNPFLLKLMGYTKDELIGKELWEVGVFKDIQASKASFKELQTNGYIRYEDMPLQTKDGRVAEVEFVSNTYVSDSQLFIQCNIRDITDRKNTERRLFEANQRLLALMNALPVGVNFSGDITCERITGNSAMLKYLGMNQGDNISASTSDLSAPGRKLKHYQNGREMNPSELPMQRAINEDREITPMEIEARLPNGRRWFHEASAAPIRDIRGNVMGAVAVNIDLTERKKLEAIMEEQKRFEAEKLKAGFIADATHELRTPLAIIKGNVDLALSSEKKSVASAYSTFKAINEEIRHLSELLSDLTLLTTDKNAEVERKLLSNKVNLSQLITRVAGRCQTLANKNKISINVKVSPNISVWGDTMYLEKLFINIITNAILYCKKNGKVLIYDTKAGNTVSVSVKDNGIGIPEAEMSRIFERFYRVEKARLINHGGTGLGLAISRWVVELHGGKIDVSSIEGKGSVFTITLPVFK